MLHQDPLDVPALTVLHNLMAGASAGRGQASFDAAEAAATFADISKTLGFRIDPRERVSDLTVGERQQSKTTCLMALGAKTLILDEPTTGISAMQKDRALRRRQTPGRRWPLDHLRLAQARGRRGPARRSHRHAAGQGRGDQDPARGRAPARELAAPGLGPGDDDVRPRAGSAPRARPTARNSPPFSLSLSGIVLRMAGCACKSPTSPSARARSSGCPGWRAAASACSCCTAPGLPRCCWAPARPGRPDPPNAPRLPAGLESPISPPTGSRTASSAGSPSRITSRCASPSPGTPGVLVDRAAATEGAEKAITALNIRGRPDSRVERLSGGNQQRAQLARRRPAST